MKATEAALLQFLKKSPQFVIPIYQRTYSWTDRECEQLWEDIMRAGRDDEVPAHFVGSVVYIEQGVYQVTSQTPLLVIDGDHAFNHRAEHGFELLVVVLELEPLALQVGNASRKLPIHRLERLGQRADFVADMGRRSLGRFAILWQIGEAERLGLEAVYLGYWIKNCRKMNYKTQYRPIELFVNQRWTLLT